MAGGLTRRRIEEAFGRLGEDLRSRGSLVEIAVYGGTAIVMQFDWRDSTEDVDAVVRAGFDEATLAPSVRRVADDMGLAPDWLNNAVGMFTPVDEDAGLFTDGRSYPADGRAPGLRIVMATPSYLLGLKLHALSSPDRGDRDLDDARRLAGHLGVTSEDELLALHRSLYDDEPTPTARARYAAVLEG